MKMIDVLGLVKDTPWYNVKLKLFLFARYRIGNVLDSVASHKERITGGRSVLILAESTNHIYANSVWGVAEYLKNLGVHDIYVMPATIFRMPIWKMKLRDYRNVVLPLQDFCEPEVIKFLAYEGCNLNCAGCSHFASINPAPRMLSMGELDESLFALKRKFTYVKNIQFLGGEPLMNPNLGAMIEKIHEVFPYCNIGVITNGLLLLSVQDELLEIFKKHRIYLAITRYKPIESRIEDIKKRLEKFEIRYEVSGLIKAFRLQYNSIGNQDAAKNHHKCLDWCCHTIRGNKVGGCYYSVTCDISNQVLHTNIPEDGCFDYTSNEYTGAELLQKLTGPAKLCAYCNSVPSPTRPWHQVTDTLDVKDWFWNDSDDI